MTEKQESYRIYLQSSHWRYVRGLALKRDCNKCFECGESKSLQVHHVCYRESPYNTRLTDLITLCNSCHEKEHRIIRDEYGNIVNFKQSDNYLNPNTDSFKEEYPKDSYKVYILKEKRKKIRKFLKLKRKRSKFNVYGRYHR